MDLSQEELHELFEYDAYAKNCLRCRKTGREVGCKDGTVSFNKKKYRSEVVVWQYVYGDLTADCSVKKKHPKENPTVSNISRFSKLEIKRMLKAKTTCKWEEILYYYKGRLYWKVDNFKVADEGRDNPLINFKDYPLHYIVNVENYLRVYLRTNKGDYHNYARIIWYLHHGVIDDDLKIDHIDGNPMNNSIENLRLVEHSVNLRNRGLSRMNKSGKTGLMLRDGLHWVGFYTEPNGKTKSKSFAINKYGYDNAYNMALAFRMSSIERVNKLLGEDGYTERHMNSEEV